MPTLNDKAMLVRLKISKWSARKYERAISDEVAAKYNAGGEAGRYNKILMAHESFREIDKVASEARRNFYENTLPWEDAGSRLLPNARYFEYMESDAALRERFDAAVEAFLPVYPEAKEAARERLGDLYDPSDYPHPEELRERFSYRSHITPLTDPNDFRIGVGDAERERIAHDIEARFTEATREAANDCWRRLHKVIKSAVNRLSDKDAVFRDSLIGNISDLCAILPSLNISGDPELDRLRAKVETSLAVLNPKDLRTDANARKAAAKASAEILREIEAGPSDGAFNAAFDAAAVGDGMSAYTG